VGGQPDVRDTTAQIDGHFLGGGPGSAERVGRAGHVVRGHRSAFGLVGVQRAEGGGDSAEHPRRGLRAAALAPSTPPSVEQIAWTAGVSRSTVYLIFGSRAGLFDALALFSMAQNRRRRRQRATARIEENRAGGMAHLAQRLADQDTLRPDVTADVLWPLGSVDQLYTGRNLPVDDVAPR
jgi:hypothetical protein